MVQGSWFFRNGLFYTILALVLLLHIILLAMRMYKDLDLVEVKTPDASRTTPPIKIKILPESRVTEKKQIVQSEDSDSKVKPKDSAYLSDKDRSFDRETMARKIDTFKTAGKGAAKDKGKVSKSRPGKDDISLSDLGAFTKGHHPLKEAAERSAKGGGPKAGTNIGDPQKEGVSSTNDFVDTVPLGDLTALNTVEFKYYGFYHRIRQKLEQFWGRSIQEKAESIIKAGRKVASDENLITGLEVTLNDQGDIVDVAIKSTSGVKELDDAAIESFNQAGPFPNPPRGMVHNGHVKIEWGFVVKT
jgi:TonB family protein